MDQLLLFDIDATMITTGGSGMTAMKEAGQELFGPGFKTDGINFAGRLDPLIIAEMFKLSGVPHQPSQINEFRRVYAFKLAERLEGNAKARALPGVAPLLRALVAADAPCLGVLTGNFEETGSMKLRACGIDPGWFDVRVWGDDSPTHPPSRDQLPGVAIDRFREAFGRPIHGSQVTVIGDTPHDVSCGKAHACRVLAVATGSYSVDQLREAGADRVEHSLEDTPGLLRWLLEP